MGLLSVQNNDSVTNATGKVFCPVSSISMQNLDCMQGEVLFLFLIEGRKQTSFIIRQDFSCSIFLVVRNSSFSITVARQSKGLLVEKIVLLGLRIELSDREYTQHMDGLVSQPLVVREAS